MSKSVIYFFNHMLEKNLCNNPQTHRFLGSWQERGRAEQKEIGDLIYLLI